MLRLAWAGEPETLNEFAAMARRLKGARVTALAHPDVASLQSRASTGSAVYLEPSAQELLRRHAFELDAIVLGASALAEGVPGELLSGKYILLDGGFALERSELEALDRLCAAVGATVMVAGSRRFGAEAQTVRASLDAGSLGVPGLMRLHRWVPGRMPAGAQDPAVALAGRAAAEIDLCCWLFGGLPEAVHATQTGAIEAPEEFQAVQLHLGFPGGGMALLDLAVHAALAEPYVALTLIGSSGAAYYDDHANAHLLLAGQGQTALSGVQSAGLARLRELHAFVGAAFARRAVVPTVQDVLGALRVVEAARRSLAVGQTAAPGGWPP
jgi:predicted dehydrogenase